MEVLDERFKSLSYSNGKEVMNVEVSVISNNILMLLNRRLLKKLKFRSF